jgi:serine/threonine protein kinase
MLHVVRQVDPYQGYDISEKVDVWAMGVLLFKFCFGRTPFEDRRGNVENLGILSGFIVENAVPPSALEAKDENGAAALNPTLLQVMTLCMDKNPDTRPSSAQVSIP